MVSGVCDATRLTTAPRLYHVATRRHRIVAGDDNSRPLRTPDVVGNGYPGLRFAYPGLNASPYGSASHASHVIASTFGVCDTPLQASVYQPDGLFRMLTKKGTARRAVPLRLEEGRSVISLRVLLLGCRLLLCRSPGLGRLSHLMLLWRQRVDH